MTALIVMALQPRLQAEAGKEWDRRILFSVIPGCEENQIRNYKMVLSVPE